MDENALEYQILDPPQPPFRERHPDYMSAFYLFFNDANEGTWQEFLHDPYQRNITPEEVQQKASNRTILSRAIYNVARDWELPITDIHTDLDTDYDMWREPFHYYRVTLTLGPGPWVRPGYQAEIIFNFQDTDDSLVYPAWESVKLVNIETEYYARVGLCIDNMLQM